MTKITRSNLRPKALAAALVAFGLSAAPAQALSNRAWVSGHGSDAAGCGSPASPCRTFQYVHDNIIAAGGEIDVLDPAGFGTITITKALSIVNDGVGTAGVQAASGNGITINAGSSDAVFLRGLNIDGLGTGANGIVFNSGGSLTVTNCSIRHFHHSGTATTGNGILLQPTAGSNNFLISNTIAADNDYVGIFYDPPSGNASFKGVIDHTVITNSYRGIYFYALSATGGVVDVTISDSTASNNSNYGMVFAASEGAMTAMVDSSHANNNGFGIYGDGAANILLSRSVVTANATYGIYNGTQPNTFYSYGDNSINKNGSSGSSDISGTALNTSFTLR
jgi:hypothetical protein